MNKFKRNCVLKYRKKLIGGHSFFIIEVKKGNNMVQKRNYQKELEQILEQILHSKHIPTLLLHSCCAPCSSYVLEYLSEYFEITLFYYNPNITSLEEYQKRVEEQKRFLKEKTFPHPIHFLEGNYNPKEFLEAIHGYEQIPEGGERCFRCYELRLTKTAEIAKQYKFDYFTTTLSISPMKNAEKLNEIGCRLQPQEVIYLVSDFKKKGGYQRSIELSKLYGLYRQDYCGCEFSKQEAQNRQHHLK